MKIRNKGTVRQKVCVMAVNIRLVSLFNLIRRVARCSSSPVFVSGPHYTPQLILWTWASGWDNSFPYLLLKKAHHHGLLPLLHLLVASLAHPPLNWCLGHCPHSGLPRCSRDDRTSELQEPEIHRHRLLHSDLYFVGRNVKHKTIFKNPLASL